MYLPKLLLLLFMVVSFTAIAQNRQKFHHIIKKEKVDNKYLKLMYRDPANNLNPIKICHDELKAVVTLVQGTPVIDFWQIKDDIGVSNPNCVNKNTKLGRFELDFSRPTVGDPTKFVNIPFVAWTFGIGTTPLRYRFKTDSSVATIASTLSVSLTYGRTFGISKVSPRAIINKSITVGPFIGLASADIKKETVKQPSSWTTPNQTNVAISYGANVVLARNNVGLVISFGFDNAIGKNASKWSYQNKPWLGLGINTNLSFF